MNYCSILLLISPVRINRGDVLLPRLLTEVKTVNRTKKITDINKLGWALTAAAGLALMGTTANAIDVNDTQTKAVPAVNSSPEGKICKVSCVSPFNNSADADKVIETLQLLVRALNEGDLSTYQEYLDEGCTTFDEGTKRLIVGKEAVLDYIKSTFNRFSKTGPTPLLSFTIDHPCAQVHGDIAVITFRAVREIGGKHPCKEVSRATDVFVKAGDKWKKLHCRGQWKKAS